MRSFGEMLANLFALGAIVSAACFVAALYVSPILVPIGVAYILFHFAAKYW
ncbi:hypothetical protein UFOVP75_36 [uncultured Caudovirales phage]|uniref:Uncharacterized protein n=1 Tax=uncultured Caudovirales phage TaxID=2100421 RepID=A0A6J5KXR3_9CAUD|nr:hypothetical protein UFOVP75_36 [uncultured Caudovirales phage]